MGSRRLDYGWRLICTGAAFAAFSLGGAMIALIGYPAIALTAEDGAETRRRFRALVSWSFRLFIGALRGLGVISVVVDDEARLRDCRASVIVANHPSLLDVVLIVAYLPRALCVVKSALWRHPFLGFVVRAAGYVPSDAAADELLARTSAAIRDGDNVLIFPEGTRSTVGIKGRLHRGFSNIALFAGADVQPLLIDCDPPTLKRGDPWYRIPDRTICYRIRVGERLSVKSYSEVGTRALGARRLTRTVETLFEGAKT